MQEAFAFVLVTLSIVHMLIHYRLSIIQKRDILRSCLALLSLRPAAALVVASAGNVALMKRSGIKIFANKFPGLRFAASRLH